MNNKLVSIITPTYNRADLLPETIESVLRQDYPNFEYIVLDDGSKDNTKEIISSYIAKLQYYFHDNMGETATVNKGFELAKGEIICVINSDDPFFRDDAISQAVKYLEKDESTLMAYPDWVSIDENGNIIEEVRLPQYTLLNMLETAKVCLGPGMFIRRNAINLIGPRDKYIKYTGDLDYSFKIVSRGSIIHIPEFLATHRIHSQSLSNQSQGARMANEVAKLVETYINYPILNVRPRKKKKILAKWYFSCIFFTGSDYKEKANFFIKAIQQSPLTVINEIITRGIKFLTNRSKKNFR